MNQHLKGTSMNLKAIAIAASTLIATGCAQMDKPPMHSCSKKAANATEQTQASCAKKEQACAKKEQACAKKQ